MERFVKFSVMARDEAEFESLMARVQLIDGIIVTIKKDRFSMSGHVLRSYVSDYETLVIVMEFDTLMLLAHASIIDNGLAALQVAEQLTKH